MERQGLKDLGEKTAEECVDDAVRLAIEEWAEDIAFERVNLSARSDAVQMLVAAVKELNDTRAAYNCVSVWISLGTRALPPNWRVVDELIREHPDLLKIGLIEKMNRGLVPPPWFTVAVS